MVLMFCRLGLRVSEVAGLTLDDIDWADGRLSVVGKLASRLACGDALEPQRANPDGNLDPGAVPHRAVSHAVE